MPRESGPLKFLRASRSMPRLGSQPNTRPVGPTTFTAPRTTAPVPVATSSTFMPGRMPARQSEKRRYRRPTLPNMSSTVL